MSFSKIDICNQTLSHLGVKQIASLSENTAQAVRINYVYNTIRDGLLRDYTWPFATVIETLNQLNGETVPGWNYLYLYPPKCMHINKIFQDTDSTDPEALEYKQIISPTTKQKSLASDYTPLYIEYVYEVDDPSFYDADFIKAFALKMASELAFVLTGNLELGPKLAQEFVIAVSGAKRTAGQEKKKNSNPTSSYEDAR